MPGTPDGPFYVFSFLFSLRVALQDPRGDDEALDFARALVDLSDASVAIGSFDRIFAAVAVAAVNLDGFVRHASGHLAGKQLGDRSLHRETGPRILFPCRAAGEQTSRVNFGSHVRKHELNRLKIGNRMAERLALLRVGKRRLECALGYAGGLRGNTDAAAIKRRERDLVALAFLPDPIPDGNFTIGERKLGAGCRMDAEFLLFLADSETRSSLLHDERRDALLAFLRLRVDVHDRGVGCSAVRDPRLGAIDDVAIVFSNRLRPQRRGIRPRLRLGKRVAADFFAARERRQKSLLLFLSAEPMDGIAVERVLHGQNDA